MNGVRVTYDDGRYSIITRDVTGAVTETEYDGVSTFVYEAEHGLLESAFIEDGTRDTFSYDFETANILPLKPWSRMIGTQIVRDQSGAEIERVGFSYHTLGESTYAIGACSFDAMKVLTYYDFEEEQTVVELTYLVDLGIPLNTAYGFSGVVDVYRPVSITAE